MTMIMKSLVAFVFLTSFVSLESIPSLLGPTNAHKRFNYLEAVWTCQQTKVSDWGWVNMWKESTLSERGHLLLAKSKLKQVKSRRFTFVTLSEKLCWTDGNVPSRDVRGGVEIRSAGQQILQKCMNCYWDICSVLWCLDEWKHYILSLLKGISAKIILA